MNSPDDALQTAVTALLSKLEAQEQSVIDTKKTINTLLHHIGKQAMFPDVDQTASRTTLVVRPDQFYGRPLATVAQEVLEMRGQAMSAQDVIDTLATGGYDFDSQGWKEKDRLRAFTITLSKNNKAFHRLPNGFFGLPGWYPEALKRKQSQRTEKESIQTDDPAGAEDNLEESV